MYKKLYIFQYLKFVVRNFLFISKSEKWIFKILLIFLGVLEIILYLL